MPKQVFLACVFFLLTNSAFAAERSSDAGALETAEDAVVLEQEIPMEKAAADSLAKDGETCDASALPKDQLVKLAVDFRDTEAAAPVEDLACGGPFPIFRPGSCVQSCQPCLRNSDCPPFAGRIQKCCSYCP